MSDVVQLLRELVRIDSVNPDIVPGAAGEAKAAEHVARWLSDRGFAVQRLEARAGRPSIVGIRKGKGGGRSLMLNGHLDTVGVAGYLGDPFSARIEGGRLHGRGSIDMKAGVAAMLVAAERAARTGLAGDLLVACVADEECASIGSEEVAAAFHPDAVIVTEPTDLDIVVTHKGFVWLDIAVEGKAAHGSRPDLGIDAIAKAGHFLVAIEALDQRLRGGRPVPLLGTGSVHASLITGGQEMSSYPERCTVRIERRTVPGETVEGAEQEVRTLVADLAKSVPEFRARVTRGLAREPLPDAGSSALVQCLETAAAARLGRRPRRSGMTGWTDCAIFAAGGIPSVLFGPSGEGLHAATEWADIASVEAVTDVLTETVTRFCGADASL